MMPSCVLCWDCGIVGLWGVCGGEGRGARSRFVVERRWSKGAVIMGKSTAYGGCARGERNLGGEMDRSRMIRGSRSRTGKGAICCPVVLAAVVLLSSKAGEVERVLTAARVRCSRRRRHPLTRGMRRMSKPLLTACNKPRFQCWSGIRTSSSAMCAPFLPSLLPWSSPARASHRHTCSM